MLFRWMALRRQLNHGSGDNYLDTHRPLCIRRKGQSIAFVQLQENSGIWFFVALKKDRNTLKYRCPAAVYGFSCKGCGECSSAGQVNPGEYGRIVRIKIIEEDRRIFTPIPYGTQGWDRAYNRRSSLERINSRLDNDFGFEKHYIRGKAKMQTRIGLATAVMMAMALGHVRAGRIEQMRSLVRPVALAA